LRRSIAVVASAPAKRGRPRAGTVSEDEHMRAPSDARAEVARAQPELAPPGPWPKDDDVRTVPWPAEEPALAPPESFWTVLLRALSAWPN